MEENNFNFDIDTFVCPFIDNGDDHLEVQNTNVYFNTNTTPWTLKPEINENTVIFLNEVENGLDPEKCLEAIIKAQTDIQPENSDEGGEGNE